MQHATEPVTSACKVIVVALTKPRRRFSKRRRGPRFTSAPIGRLTRLLEGTGAFNVGYCYDKRGNLIRKRQSAGGKMDITSTTYDKADRPLSITTPDNTLITYTYDTSGRLTKVSVTPAGGGSTSRLAVSALTWRPFGPISSYTLGNGQHVVRTYDANDRLTDLASPAFNLHLKRDAMGNIVALGNAPGASPATETYRYDRLYRLQGAFSPTSALETYGYNRTGDRISKNGSGLATGLYTYAAGTHRLTGTGNAVRTGYELAESGARIQSCTSCVACAWRRQYPAALMLRGSMPVSTRYRRSDLALDDSQAIQA